MCNYLGDASWDSVLDGQDVNIAYAKFISKFKCSLDMHCPVRNVKILKTKNYTPWILKTLKDIIRKKNKLYITFLNKRKCDTENHHKKYKNKLVTILRQPQRQYYFITYIFQYLLSLIHICEFNLFFTCIGPKLARDIEHNNNNVYYETSCLYF